MNNIMEAHKRKLSPQQSIVTAIEGLADELYELRKENRDLKGELRNIAGSLDYASQYLYDISWELKKNREKNLDLSEQVNQYYTMTKTIDITPTWSALIPIMVEVLKNPKANNSAKQEVVVELKRLAKIVDDQNKKLREDDSSKNQRRHT